MNREKVKYLTSEQCENFYKELTGKHLFGFYELSEVLTEKDILKHGLDGYLYGTTAHGMLIIKDRFTNRFQTVPCQGTVTIGEFENERNDLYCVWWSPV